MNKKETTAKKDGKELFKSQLIFIDLLKKRLELLQKSEQLETDCKNQAYFFILSKGYFDEFREYAKNKPIQ